MTASTHPTHEPATSSLLQRDFRVWVEATSSPEELVLGIEGFSYADLYQPVKLAELTERFRAFLRERDSDAAEKLAALERGGGKLASAPATSDAYIVVAGHLSAFLARMFCVEAEVEALRRSLLAHDPVWSFKRDFVKKRVFKGEFVGFDPIAAAAAARQALVAAGADKSLLGKGSEAEELAVARATLRLLEVEDTARKVAKAGGACWRSELSELAASVAAALAAEDDARKVAAEALATAEDPEAPHIRSGAVVEVALKAVAMWLAARSRDQHDPAHAWSSLREPRKLDFQNLVQIRRPDQKLPNLFVGPETHRRERDGFALTDPRGTPRRIQGEVDYCLYCHDRDKDSCSKGMRDPKTGAIKPNPLGVPLHGCPLEEKISEMHLLRHRGDALGALALVCIDNPMCAGTGHRICNDCMKACIFQKQEPVNIPQIETATLTDVLALPWGVEIYGLLTRWNPLNVRLPHPAPLNGRSALVVGLGPAGYTLAHHLSRAGFAVAGVDGLKIEPLPVELTGDEQRPPRPIRDFRALSVALDERIILGFGGVSEYGITVRWDKNFLTLAYLTLARNRRIRIYGGVRFGGTLTLEDAWALGFDHVALAAGAGRPTIIPLKNNMARGIRKASDFLMGLQLTGAYKHSSLANLQIRLPAIVIGGGLTAIDTATELLAYYVTQVEKTADRYHALVRELGEEAVRKGFDGEELEFLDEQLRHAEAIAEERARARAAGRAPAFQKLLEEWGGVSIAYRKSVLDSPAYRLNHEEVEKSLEEGVRYLENLSPLEAVLDETGALRSVKFERCAHGEDGKWKATGEVIDLPARTLCIAAGTSPNTTLEKENPGIFALDARKQFFQAYEAQRGEDGKISLTPASDVSQGFFTSYHDGTDHTVSFYGDNHPYYAGSVVKAMASAKVGFEKVAELYRDSGPVSEEERARRRNRIASLFRALDDQLIATVHDVIRLTPTIVEVIVRAPLAARNFQPGQFYRLQNFEQSAPMVEGTRLAMEGLALTGAWVDKEKGLMSTIVLEMGASSRLCALLRKGERVSLMGPTGTPTEIPTATTSLLAGGGLGNAVLFSIARAMKEKGTRVLYFAGYRRGEDLFHQDDIEASTDQVIWCTDGGREITPRRPQDRHFRGNIIQAMVAFAKGELGSKVIELSSVSRIIAIGSDRMMAAVQQARHGVLAPFLDRHHIGIGSINSPMQCMMKEICAQCLQKHRDPITGEEFFVFSCSNQDQELDCVDFQHLQQRLRANSVQEKLSDQWLSALLARHPEIERV
ncbi:MAG: FAD-dependent oxidoreductase [Myxococcales bacterium]|nr:FAD-dependent oxidoreductase [Polyangiaceae bacterium]MDW8250355.1 FAD-dependent oxidoreductase [Myxococcales bacterium]